MIDEERCYEICRSRDGRFDGTFVIAVRTTGIYCRPSCPAMTPRRHNVDFYPTPAAAQDAGFRACKRCRPDAAPGSPEWDARADLVARAVRLIGDGVVDREGVGGLARRLNYTPRQVHRLVQAELGTGPLRLARAHRVQNARALLENTDLPVTDVAWASGFSSVRQFNDQIRTTYALSPTEIRARRTGTRTPTRTSTPAGARREAAPAPGQGITAYLTYREPMDIQATLRFLGRRAVPGVEYYDGVSYSAVLRLPRGLGVATVQPAEPDQVDGSSRRRRPDRAASHDRHGRPASHDRHGRPASHDRHGRPASHDRRPASRPAVECSIRLDDVRDHAAAVSRLRRLLDLDADPAAIAASLGTDPLLGPSVAARPGLRMPGCTDPCELAIRAVLGQGVTVAAARKLAGHLTELCGEPLDEAVGELRRAFPTPEAIAALDPAALPLPRQRAAALHDLAVALAGGALLDTGSDRDRAERDLLAIPGIGPWTAAYIRMRGLGDPDVFLPGDAAIRRATGAEPAPETWKPWRSYAVAHLWASLETSSEEESKK